MKYLGIDFGSKRIGLAVSDESLSFAFPLVVLPNTDNLLSEIVSVCKEQDITEIVVGESQNFAMEDNQIMEEVKSFVLKLKGSINLPVHLHPEFLTSVEAERLQGKNDMLDASAAAIILRHFLETKK